MPKMNSCFLLGNPEQTPLARGARVGVAHRRREEAWQLSVVFVRGFQVRNMDLSLSLVYENDSQVRSMEKYYGE